MNRMPELKSMKSIAEERERSLNFCKRFGGL